MDRVGVIGLGKMGLPIAMNLMERGFRVTGYRRSGSPELKAAGGATAGSAAEVAANADVLLSIVPGAELVEIDVPRVGTQANSLAQLPDFKRELVRREFAAVADAGVTTLATIYHACHRQICDAGDGRSFEIVNFMEILGEGLGLYSDDLYKRLKLIGDIDEMIVETAPLIEGNRLDLDTVRDALLAEFGANE